MLKVDTEPQDCMLRAQGCLTNLQERFDFYWGCSGYSNETKILAALESWGANKFHVPLPSFRDMLQEQLLAPFFVFQTFCVGLWCLDEYWYSYLSFSTPNC